MEREIIECTCAKCGRIHLRLSHTSLSFYSFNCESCGWHNWGSVLGCYSWILEEPEHLHFCRQSFPSYLKYPLKNEESEESKAVRQVIHDKYKHAYIVGPPPKGF